LEQTIETLVACEAAALHLEKEWGTAGGADHAGGGCFYHSDRDIMGFNENLTKTWSTWEVMRAVCHESSSGACITEQQST
jgi:hypothetical protein